MLAILEGTFFAILVVYTCAVIALPLSDRLLPRQHLLLRALAALLIAATMLTLIFHALLPFSAFTRVGVGALLLLSLAGARFAGLDHAAAAHVLARDVKTVARGLVQIQSWPARIFGGVVVLLLSVTALRSLMLPTIGWDSITYHYVKAGMWVQSGGPITLDAPGGWSLYRSFLGGGEDMPLSDEESDLVFSNCVLEHTDGRDAVLEHVGRILRSGGQFILTVPSEDAYEAIAIPRFLHALGIVGARGDMSITSTDTPKW